jgi:hypothetical protein
MKPRGHVKVETSDKDRDELVDLQDRDVLSDACSGTEPERHEVLVHELHLAFVRFQPPLWSELVGVVAKNCGVSVCDPGVYADVDL